MVTKRTQDHVQETPKQPDKTIVSIEWLSSLWIDAANHNEVCNKYCNDLGRDSNLEFVLPFAIRVPLELSCQPKGDLVLQSQRPPVQILCYIYIYVPINIYMDTMNILSFVFGKRTLARVYQDHLSKPMELQKTSSQK